MNLKFLTFILCCLFIYNSSSVSAKPKKGKKNKANKNGSIPDTIKGVLTLKPRKKPYFISKTTIPKGATLNILAGVTLKPAENIKKGGAKLIVNGTLNILGKRSAPVIMSLESFSASNGILNISDGDILVKKCNFISNTTGKIKNTKFKHTTSGTNGAKMTIEVPDTGVLLYDNCCFLNMSVEVKKTDMLLAIKHLNFNKCAFLLLNKDGDGKKRKPMRKMSSEVFALGSKCDVQHQVIYNAMNWSFKSPLKKEWYFYVDTTKNSINDMVKSNKSLNIKYSKKPYTSYKPKVETKLLKK
ncbi:MAG: hypothetical protein COA79_13940 [Planctomycetota bacterium]|nr:MAG: hypothetical protein COA79_13940 [Planctomycetota bacterium]